MKISAIVPVYNAEKYVSKCIESVLSQTYSDWELWLVDDGSQDNSLSILQEYSNKDSRINVIHQENGGAGMARNAAIQRVSGDYIVFIDSDDYVEKEYFSLIVKKNTDVVFIDVLQRNDKNEILRKECISQYSKYNKDDVIRFQMTGKMPWGGVRKAVKTHIVKDNNILFSHHKVGEEAIYSFLVLLYANDFSFIDIPVYNYVLHHDSLSHTPLDDPWGNVGANLKEKITELGLFDTYASTLKAFAITALVVSLDKMAQKYYITDYLIKAKNRMCSFNDSYGSDLKADSLHMMLSARISWFVLSARLFLLFYFVSKIRRIINK